MAVIGNLSAGQVLTASTVNTYMINSGLVYVGSTTATSGTTVDVLGCFTSTYDAYRIVISDARTTAAANLYFSCLAGSTINASNWTWVATKADYNTAAWVISKATADSSCNFGVADTIPTAAMIDVSQPFLSRGTNLFVSGSDSRTTTGYMVWTTAGYLNNTTSYSGLRITSSQTITNMKVTVYGYRLG